MFFVCFLSAKRVLLVKSTSSRNGYAKKDSLVCMFDSSVAQKNLYTPRFSNQRPPQARESSLETLQVGCQVELVGSTYVMNLRILSGKMPNTR